jgi:hypothetical protein
VYDNYQAGPSSIAQFEKHARLIYANCVKYNSGSSGKVYRDAAEDQRAEFERQKKRTIEKLEALERELEGNATKLKEEGLWSVELDDSELNPRDEGGGLMFSPWRAVLQCLREKDFAETLANKLAVLVDECVEKRCLPTPALRECTYVRASERASEASTKKMPGCPLQPVCERALGGGVRASEASTKKMPGCGPDQLACERAKRAQRRCPAAVRANQCASELWGVACEGFSFSTTRFRRRSAPLMPLTLRSCLRRYLLVLAVNDAPTNVCDVGGSSWACKLLELSATVLADRRFNTALDLGETVAHAASGTDATIDTALSFSWGDQDTIQRWTSTPYLVKTLRGLVLNCVVAKMVRAIKGAGDEEESILRAQFSRLAAAMQPFGGWGMRDSDLEFMAMKSLLGAIKKAADEGRLTGGSRDVVVEAVLLTDVVVGGGGGGKLQWSMEALVSIAPGMTPGEVHDVLSRLCVGAEAALGGMLAADRRLAHHHNEVLKRLPKSKREAWRAQFAQT